MTDIAKLGFEIDSSPLAQAGLQAEQAAQKIGKVGDAADQSSARTGKATSAIVDALNRLSGQLTTAIGKMDAGTKAQADLAASMLKGADGAKNEAAATASLEAKLLALQTQLAAATAANAKQTDAAKKAADAAKQQAAATDEMKRRADAAAASQNTLGGVMGRVGGIGNKLAGEIGNLSQAFGIATGSAGGVALNAALRTSMGAFEGLGGFMGRFGPMAAGVVTGVGTIATAFVGAQAALASVQDRWAKYEGQLKSTLGSTSAAKQAVEDLYATAQGTGISFDSTVSAFNRLARNANELGASNSEILQLSSTIQKLGVVSGAGAGEISSGMLQLSQALAAGKLNGDELRSIMENMPALAKAIADGLGVSVGQLRAMGAAGELTGDKVFRAILGNADKVNQQFKQMPDTTEQAFQRVSDAWSRMLAGMGEAANSSGFIRGILNATAGVINMMNGSGQVPMSKEQAELASLQARRDSFAKLPGADRENSNTWRELKSLDARIAALQPAVSQQQADAEKARRDEDYRPAISIYSRGATVAKEAKTLAGDQNELADQVRTIENALIAAGQRGTAPTLPPDQIPNRAELDKMEGALTTLKQKLADTTSALAKFTQGTAEYREALGTGGTGGGLDIVKQAQDLAKQLRGQGIKAGTSDTIGAVIQDRALRAGEEVRALDRQTEAQKKLAGTVGATRDAVREAEIAQEAYDYRIKTFGNITTPAVEKAVGAYTAALRRQKQAQDALADGRAFKAIADQIEVLQAGAAAAGQGAYAIREAEARARAAQADRQTPGLGGEQLRVFRLNEQRSIDQQIEQLDRQAAASRRMGGARSLGEQRQIGLDQRIEDAQRGVAPGERNRLAGAMRAADEADVAKALNDQKLSIEDQLAMQAEQLKLVGTYGEELAVQQAVLAKRNELLKQGVDITSEAAQEVLQLTAQQARGSFQLDEAQKQADAFHAIWTSAADGIQDSISGAFIASFSEGQKAGDTLRQGLSDTFKKMSQSIMNDALNPLKDALTSLLKQGGSWLVSALGGGSATVPMQPGGGYALGGTFGVDAAFANGGTFTNRIVSSPTLFKFAKGGSVKTGLMGEAGEEAVMPLRRGPDGRLGVSAAGGGGGGNQISVAVHVDASGGSQVQSGGDTADNQGRQLGEAISRAVKDELLTQMRPGGLLAKK